METRVFFFLFFFWDSGDTDTSQKKNDRQKSIGSKSHVKLRDTFFESHYYIIFLIYFTDIPVVRHLVLFICKANYR